MANLRADRAAAAGDDDGFALHQRFQPRIVDRFARPQQEILDRDIGEPRRIAALERRQPAHDQMQPACAHQEGFGTGVRLEGRRHHHDARNRFAAPGEIADHLLDVIAVAEHRNIADRLPAVGARRREDSERPESLHRAALDAAQQHLGIGGASDQEPGRGRLGARVMSDAGVAEIAISQAQGAQQEYLEEPVEDDGDAAKEESADRRRDDDPVQHHERQRQHGRHAHDLIASGKEMKRHLVVVSLNA